MKIISNVGYEITITDIDRGIADGQTDTYATFIQKQDNGIPAHGHIYVFDSDAVMMSTAFGQIHKWVDLGHLSTQYSITGTQVGPFAITNSNKTFVFDIGAITKTVTLPTGPAVTMTQIVSAINSTVGAVSGFAAENSSMFRTINMSPMTNDFVQGELGGGYGVRSPSIYSGFLSLAADLVITIGPGNANATLGFYEDQVTKSS